MWSIGRMARECGLSVSALRFYDGAGVLIPAWVDPDTGYRWYSAGQLAESRVLSRLRRTGMPLADIRLVLAGWSGADTGLVRRLLDAHLHRLEAGLDDARDQLSAVRALLDDRENPMTAASTAAIEATFETAELAAALDAVRFAAGTDPDLPTLGGVLFDMEGGELRLCATDRYRLAVARVPAARHGGGRVQAVVPSALVDAIRALLGGDAPARLTLDGKQVEVRTAGGQAAGPCIGQEFPDYRRLVRLPAGRRTAVAVPALRDAVCRGPVRSGEVRAQDGVPFDISVLTVAADGAVSVGDETYGDGREQVGVNRDFLLQALDAAGRDRLILEFGGPTAPLALRRTDTEDAFSLLMPVRLDQ